MYSRDMRGQDEYGKALVKGHEIVAVLKPSFPKFDKNTLSRVENHSYGVRFLPDAEEKVLAYLAARGTAKAKKDCHRHKRRVQFRMSEDAYTEFERLRQESGFSTAQGFLEYLFYEYRKGQDK